MTPLEEAVRMYVAKGSGLDPKDVIPGNDPHPRPYVSYATLLPFNDRRTGYPARLQDEDAEMTSSSSYRRASFSLQFYRKGAMDYARDFVIWCESEIGSDHCGRQQLRAIVQTPPLEWDRIDEIVGDAFEERVLINNGTFMVDYIQNTVQATGFVDRFDGELEYGDQTADVTHTP